MSLTDLDATKADTTPNPPFFTIDGGAFVPTTASRAPGLTTWVPAAATSWPFTRRP